MFKELEKYCLSKPGATKEYPFGEGVGVYKVGGKMFALMPDDKDPASISLKCDPELGATLREKYDSVMPGYHLNKKHWITVVAAGELSEDEIKDLINHSYLLVTKDRNDR